MEKPSSSKPPDDDKNPKKPHPDPSKPSKSDPSGEKREQKIIQIDPKLFDTSKLDPAKTAQFLEKNLAKVRKILEESYNHSPKKKSPKFGLSAIKSYARGVFKSKKDGKRTGGAAESAETVEMSKKDGKKVGESLPGFQIFDTPEALQRKKKGKEVVELSKKEGKRILGKSDSDSDSDSDLETFEDRKGAECGEQSKEDGNKKDTEIEGQSEKEGRGTEGSRGTKVSDTETPEDKKDTEIEEQLKKNEKGIEGSPGNKMSDTEASDDRKGAETVGQSEIGEKNAAGSPGLKASDTVIPENKGYSENEEQSKNDGNVIEGSPATKIPDAETEEQTKKDGKEGAAGIPGTKISETEASCNRKGAEDEGQSKKDGKGASGSAGIKIPGNETSENKNGAENEGQSKKEGKRIAEVSEKKKEKTKEKPKKFLMRIQPARVLKNSVAALSRSNFNPSKTGWFEARKNGFEINVNGTDEKGELVFNLLSLRAQSMVKFRCPKPLKFLFSLHAMNTVLNGVDKDDDIVTVYHVHGTTTLSFELATHYPDSVPSPPIALHIDIITDVPRYKVFPVVTYEFGDIIESKDLLSIIKEVKDEAPQRKQPPTIADLAPMNLPALNPDAPVMSPAQKVKHIVTRKMGTYLESLENAAGASDGCHFCHVRDPKECFMLLFEIVGHGTLAYLVNGRYFSDSELPNEDQFSTLLYSRT